MGTNVGGGEGIARRRSSAASLPKLDCGRARYDSISAMEDDDFNQYPVVQDVKDTEVNEDIIEEGKELFQNFVKDEIQRQGLCAPNSCFDEVVSTPIGYKNPKWAKAGKELREMADAFSKSKERDRVKTKAQNISLSQELTYEQYRDLVCELFVEGITSERIIVLFFFCSDLAIRVLREKAINIFCRFLEWTTRFIKETLCAWVQAHGGWAVVLSRTKVYTVAVLGVFFLLVPAIYWLSKRGNK